MISCISAPSIVATQLEQLDALSGHKILEAGAATGYNAALLGHMAAPGGHVWTVDVDQDLVNNAASHLAAASAENMTVRLAGGAAGPFEYGPYDWIQFTIGAGDIPPRSWSSSLPAGGWSPRCGSATASPRRSRSSATAVFRARLGLTALDLIAGRPTPCDASPRAAVLAAASSDAYAARDVLENSVMRLQMTYRQEQEPTTVVATSGFDTRNLSADHQDALTAAVCTADRPSSRLLVLRRALRASGAVRTAGRHSADRS